MSSPNSTTGKKEIKKIEKLNDSLCLSFAYCRIRLYMTNLRQPIITNERRNLQFCSINRDDNVLPVTRASSISHTLVCSRGYSISQLPYELSSLDNGRIFCQSIHEIRECEKNKMKAKRKQINLSLK